MKRAAAAAAALELDGSAAAAAAALGLDGSAAAAAAGLFGALTNTFLVLLGIYIFFGQEYYSMAVTDSSQTLLAFLGLVVLTNGLSEAAIGAAAASAIGVPVKKAVSKRYMNVS